MTTILTNLPDAALIPIEDLTEEQKLFLYMMAGNPVTSSYSVDSCTRETKLLITSEYPFSISIRDGAYVVMTKATL